MDTGHLPPLRAVPSRRLMVSLAFGGALATFSHRDATAKKKKGKRKGKKCPPAETCPPPVTCPTVDLCPARFCCHCNAPAAPCLTIPASGELGAACAAACAPAGFNGASSDNSETSSLACDVSGECHKIACPLL